MKYEGIFRGPRLWSNEELRRIAHLFDGWVVNVSAWRDFDKSVTSYSQYILGDYNTGVPYRSYFVNAEKYSMTNYPKDIDGSPAGSTCMPEAGGDTVIPLDLEEDLPPNLVARFDVVFSHTVLEHVFNVTKAFANLCTMSKDVVILVVPFVQRVHDIKGNYRDYWRFTPFALDRLFEINGYTVLYRASSHLRQSSIYYFYVASRSPDKWKDRFPAEPLERQLRSLNVGAKIFPIAGMQLRIESLLRRSARLMRGRRGGSRA